MKLKKHKGFTLVELMVTVAIIGVLSAIGISSYQDYVAKSTVAAAMHDLYPEKTRVEIIINENREMSLDSTYDLSYTQTGNCSQITLLEGTILNDTVTIQCTMKGNSLVQNKTVTFKRDRSTGQWQCLSNVDTKFLPKSCANPLVE